MMRLILFGNFVVEWWIKLSSCMKNTLRYLNHPSPKNSSKIINLIILKAFGKFVVEWWIKLSSCMKNTLRYLNHPSPKNSSKIINLIILKAVGNFVVEWWIKLSSSRNKSGTGSFLNGLRYLNYPSSKNSTKIIKFVMPHILRKSAAYSLVELSMALSIIAILIGGALTIATNKTESDKIKKTNQNMNKIEDALEEFLIQNKRLPCPADGKSAIDASSDNSFGVETTVTLATCTGSNFTDGNNVSSGVVPVRTLGLPDDVMMDGWGRRITYVIDSRFTNNATTNTNCDGVNSTLCFKYTSNGSIKINDVSATQKSTEGVYALISHGKNGYGAFNYYGSNTRIAFPVSPNKDEIENSGDKSVYTPIFVQRTTDNDFDDIVRYKPKWQILNDAKAITDPNLCLPAKNVVNNPDKGGNNAANSCSFASDVTKCEAMAAKIASLCL